MAPHYRSAIQYQKVANINGDNWSGRSQKGPSDSRDFIVADASRTFGHFSVTSKIEHYKSAPLSNTQTTAAFATYDRDSDACCASFRLTNFKMSLAYENRGFSDYPSGTIMEEPSHDHLHQHHQRYPSPPPPMSENPYSNAQIDSALEMQLSELPHKADEDGGSPGRSKALMKPVRELVKGEDGKYLCNWVGCTEEIRSFGRKCEWSKVMK